MPDLRKHNRRWVTDHTKRIILSATTLEALVSTLMEARRDFAPHSSVSILPYHGGLTLEGFRYATPEEVRYHDEQERLRKAQATATRRRRVQEALDVLNQEAPHVLNRTNVNAEEVLEESAV